MNNPKLKRRMLWMVVGVGLLFGALFGYHMFGQYMMKQYLAAHGNPPATVTAVKMKSGLWHDRLHAVGSLRAVQGVAISSEVGGQVVRVPVHSGDTVTEGDLLVELNHADDDALLAALQADATLAEISFKRDKAQLVARAISQALFDKTAAVYAQAKAAVQRQQALIAKKMIRAPFSGKAGIVSLNQGQFIHAAEPITTLEDISALLVDFHLPQRFLAGLKAGQRLVVTSDAWPERTFSGRISAINSTVDTSSRNVRVEGQLDQPDGLLHPGMFVSVEVERGEPKEYLTLPQTAISYNAYGATVFVAALAKESTPEKPVFKARQVFVKLGSTRGDQVAVLSGISAGDMIVTSGLMKLKNGTPLIINNKVQPTNDAAPVPQEQ